MGKRGNHGAKVSNPLEFDGIRMKVGVNSFTRYFYKPQPLCTLEDIPAGVIAVQEKTEGLLDEITKGGGR
jgi:type I restriction enzyme M protein